MRSTRDNAVVYASKPSRQARANPPAADGVHMSFVRHIWRTAAALGLIVAGAAGVAATPAGAFAVNEWHPPTSPTPYSQEISDITALDAQVLNDFTTNRAAGRYFANGVWTNPDTTCWSCLDSAGTAAAVLYRQTGENNAGLFNIATSTFNTAIRTEQLPDGSFAGTPYTNGPIETEFLLVELGITDLELRDRLDPQTTANWSIAIQRATDYLINSGQTTWYANGNIQLRLVEDLWLAWKVTGLSRYEAAYENEWTFAMGPPQTRWPGFGLHITQMPTRADGSDGSGYLAESGGGAPGYDPEYTMTQLDNTTEMWILSRDPRYLRLMNLLLNQLLRRVSPVWTLDATGGSRKNAPIPFYDVAPGVLAADDDRPDLALGAAVQLWRLEVEFTNMSLYDNPNYYKGLSGWVSMVLLDSQWPNGILGPPGSSSATKRGKTPSLSMTISPSMPTASRLYERGLNITVRGAPAGSTVHIAIARGFPRIERSPRPAQAGVLGAVTVINRSSRRLVVVARPRPVRGSVERSLRSIAVVVTVTARGETPRTVVRLLTIRHK
jgi:hypothetical protein